MNATLLLLLLLRPQNQKITTENTFTLTRETIVKMFVEILTQSDCCYRIFVHTNDGITKTELNKNGNYIVCIDPLTGDATNLASCAPMGSIFSIYRKNNWVDIDLNRDFIEDEIFPEKDLLAAGYAQYDVMTKFVIALFGQVNGFIYDDSNGEFILYESNIKTPAKGKYYCANEGHSKLWEPQIIEFLRRKKDNKLGKPLKCRYLEDITYELDLIIHQGGIQLSPSNRRLPQGKALMICHAIPAAFILKNCNGLASNGLQNILDLPVDSLHHKTPLYFGSIAEVEEIKQTSNQSSKDL